HAMINLLNMVFCGILMQMFMHMYEARREEAEQRLVEVAQTDSLTGLANRASFQSTLARTIAESERSSTAFALVIMDIDHFKSVNDTLGHDADRKSTRLNSSHVKISYAVVCLKKTKLADDSAEGDTTNATNPGLEHALFASAKLCKGDPCAGHASEDPENRTQCGLHAGREKAW